MATVHDGMHWWFLSFGDQMEVLAPDSLRESIYKVAQNIIARYESKDTLQEGS